MKIQDFNIVPAHVTYSNSVVRVFLEQGNFNVKFFRDSTIVWEEEIKSLEWTAFGNQNELEDWKIEFWDPNDNKMVAVHYHLVHGSNILIVPTPKTTTQNMVSNLINECNRIKSIGGIPWTFFNGCYKFRDLLLEEEIGILMLGEETESVFPFIIEKEY